MSAIVVIATPGTFVASMGAMIDAHARLGETFATNPALGDYAAVQTRLVLAAAQPGALMLAGGYRLQGDADFADIDDLRMVFLPAFQLAEPGGIDAVLADHSRLHDWMAKVARAGVPIGACGASVFHLAASGIINGGRCAVPLRLRPAFHKRFPQITIEAGQALCVSGGSISSVSEGNSSAVVHRLFLEAFPPSVAHSIAARTTHDVEIPGQPLQSDPVVQRAQLLMRDRFTRSFRIADLAHELGLSHQALIRRFQAIGSEAPRAFVQRLRADAAASMLAETRRSVAEIAQLVGYSDIASFRSAFRAAYGMAPGCYRRSRQALRKGQ